METKTPFFILGLPRTRTAWLSVVLSMAGVPCFHEGMRDFESFEAYAAGREAGGDADPTLIYWTAFLLDQWPNAKFVVINRDSEEALADFIKASPPHMAQALQAGWATCLRGFSIARDLLRGNPNALFLEFHQLAEYETIAAIVEHVGGARPSVASVDRWQRLQVTSHITAPETLVSPRIPAVPDARVCAGDVCDVSSLSAEIYDRADFSRVAEWWRCHTGETLQEASLPPLGVCVKLDGQHAAFLWCYESYGVPVAELAFPVTRTGMNMKDARRALLYAVSCLISAAGKGHVPEASFRVFKVLAPAGMARSLQRLGFKPMRTQREPLILTL